jgi:hypothetical protein
MHSNACTCVIPPFCTALNCSCLPHAAAILGFNIVCFALPALPPAPTEAGDQAGSNQRRPGGAAAAAAGAGGVRATAAELRGLQEMVRPGQPGLPGCLPALRRMTACSCCAAAGSSCCSTSTPTSCWAAQPLPRCTLPPLALSPVLTLVAHLQIAEYKNLWDDAAERARGMAPAMVGGCGAIGSWCGREDSLLLALPCMPPAWW